ncbi:MAG TPA: NAD-dependent epimerase/dehydratase family protein [Saprospiraceae bacterium]|nr:NAD-dependent epimerase/dehydratase family protein [Saprospiraceae bacterium]
MSINPQDNANKTLITGASGYIGQRLALYLANQGETVHVLVRNRAARQILNHPDIHLFEGDIQDLEAVHRAMNGCTHAYHVAGLARLAHKDPTLFYRTNVDGTKNLLQAAFDANVKKIVYTSSTAVIGPSLNKPMRESDPRIIGYDNDYEVSKQMAENLVKEFNARGLTGVIVSPSRVYGPGIATYSSGVNRFIYNFLRRGFYFVPTCDDIKSNYTYIDDVIHGHILAMLLGRGGEKYILGGENVSFGEFMRTIKMHAENKGYFIRLPKSVIKAVAMTAQAKAWTMNQSPELTPKVVDRLFQNFSFSSEKAIAELGYSITPFDEGIRKTIVHLRNGSHA